MYMVSEQTRLYIRKLLNTKLSSPWQVGNFGCPVSKDTMIFLPIPFCFLVLPPFLISSSPACYFRGTLRIIASSPPEIVGPLAVSLFLCSPPSCSPTRLHAYSSTYLQRISHTGVASMGGRELPVPCRSDQHGPRAKNQTCDPRPVLFFVRGEIGSTFHLFDS